LLTFSSLRRRKLTLSVLHNFLLSAVLLPQQANAEDMSMFNIKTYGFVDNFILNSRVITSPRSCIRLLYHYICSSERLREKQNLIFVQTFRKW